jgi:hypothetical protein
MIQLQYEPTGSSSQAIWSDLQPQVTASSLSIALTSSFEGNYKSINVNVSSNKSNAYGGWILFNVSSSAVPTASGHYTADIYEGGLSTPAIWNQTSDVWNTITQTWSNYQISGLVGRLITTERVFVSGSDYNAIDTYENQELAYYNVYNG